MSFPGLEKLPRIMGNYDQFWAWIEERWQLCEISGPGMFQTMDADGFEILEHQDTWAIGLAVPEAPP